MKTRFNIFTHTLLFILLTFVILSIPYRVRSQTKQGIKFTESKNWSDVLSLAKAQHKFIFVDVYTTWCGPCKMMDKNVYDNQEVGELYNRDFICVKIQMDSTANDNPYVKSWYHDAKYIESSEKIEAYPTLLFYAPDGQLIFKTIGFKNVNAFTRVGKFASQPDSNKVFREDLLAYQSGQRNHKKLPELAVNVRELLGDYKLATSIAQDYKSNYLEKLSPEQFLKPENLKFIDENGDAKLVNSKDAFFKACYHHPEYIDSVLQKGYATYYLNGVVTREELTEKLFNGDSVISKNPDWVKLRNAIAKKYPKLDANKLLLQSKISFYKRLNDWDLYTKYKSEQIEKYPVQGNNFDIIGALNEPAWEVFRKTDNTSALKRALEWSIMSVELIQSDDKVELYDTQANILYKLGRKNEAILLQEKAYADARKIDKKNGTVNQIAPDVTENLEKMKKGLPTW